MYKILFLTGIILYHYIMFCFECSIYLDILNLFTLFSYLGFSEMVKYTEETSCFWKIPSFVYQTVKSPFVIYVHNFSRVLH